MQVIKGADLIGVVDQRHDALRPVIVLSLKWSSSIGVVTVFSGNLPQV